jgi:hypothetical protein
LKCLFTPYPEFFARKLQIRDKIPESNRKEGWGFQHLVQLRDLCEQYDERRNMPLLNLTNIHGNARYYDKHMRHLGGGSDDMLLSGIWMNLYGNMGDYVAHY